MSKAKLLSEKLAELDQLVAWFDQENLDIDEAIQKFDDVSTLTNDIRADLSVLENKITVLKQKFDRE